LPVRLLLQRNEQHDPTSKRDRQVARTPQAAMPASTHLALGTRGQMNATSIPMRQWQPSLNTNATRFDYS